MVTPESDDPVEFHAKGTVKGIRDGVAHVHVKFINGKRVETPATKSAQAEPGESELLEMARHADGRN